MDQVSKYDEFADTVEEAVARYSLCQLDTHRMTSYRIVQMQDI